MCQILDNLKEAYDLPKGNVGLVICNLLELAVISQCAKLKELSRQTV